LHLAGLVVVLLGLPLSSSLARAQSKAPTQAQTKPQVGANMKDQMIFGFCSRAMNADLDKAGKAAPAGMVDHTCGCVVQQINARASIDQAKTICQAQAQQKYALQ
jgi:hypothetical protein